MTLQHIRVPGGYQLYYEEETFNYKTEVTPIQKFFNNLDEHEVAAMFRGNETKYAFEYPFEINDPYYGEMNLKLRFDGRGSYYLEKQ